VFNGCRRDKKVCPAIVFVRFRAASASGLNYNSVGFSLNAMNYFGGVTPTTSFTSLRAGATRLSAVSLHLTGRFFPRLGPLRRLTWSHHG
jgi:hypothetical protein